MVRQTAKGLGADDIVYALMDQLHHFAGQKPSFPGLVSDGNDRLRIGNQIVNGSGGRKVPAFLESGSGGAAHPADCPDRQPRRGGGGFFRAQMLRLINLVVEAVQHKVQKVGHDGFRPFGFQKLHKMIVRHGGEFDEDFPYDADPGLFLIGNGNCVKGTPGRPLPICGAGR